MIQLDKLILENFISHKSTEIDMADLRGLIMVDGHNTGGKYDSNGAGKSTILEGIVYTLTGETLRKMGVNGMVNRKVGKNTRTHASMRFRGKRVEIDRYRKHENHGDSIVLHEDGVNISKRLNKETQALIDSMLGMSHRVLTNTIFLGEGLSSRFTQLSDGDKKSLIESTLNLAYDFNKCRDEANTQLKAVRNELATARGRITSLESVLRDLDKSALTAKVDQLQSAIQAAEASRAVSDAMYRRTYEQYHQLNDDKVKLIQVLNEHAQLNQQKTAVIQNVANLKRLWAEAGKGGECAVCKQSLVTPEAVHNAQAHYNAELQAQGQILLDIQDRLASLPDENEIRRQVSTIDPTLSGLSASLQDLNQKINQLTADISRMQAELQSAQDLLANADKYEAEVAQLSDRVKVLEKDEKIYAYWYQAFSPTGLLIRVLEEAVSYLNDRLETYTEMLLDRKYRMELSGGKLSLVDSANASYETLSNGEKRRLDLAIQFALHDYVHTYCGIQIDTLFIDEVLDTLDAVGISNIIDLLRTKLAYCGLTRIFVITHNQDLKSHFDRVLLVIKGKDEFSSLQII